MPFDRSQVSSETRWLYAVARDVAALVLELCSPDMNDMIVCGAEDQRSWRSADPSERQTENGLFLAFDHASPSQIWTPWGLWRFAGPVSKHRPIAPEEFLTGLKVEVVEDVYRTDLGEFGPVYAILAIEGDELPKPSLAEPGAVLDAETASGVWAQLTADWCEVNGFQLSASFSSN